MFTGLITDIGKITAIEKTTGGKILQIATHYSTDTITIGASIACSGICLTVTKCGVLAEKTENGAKGYFEVEAWEEALRLTTIDLWQIGQFINLERSLKMGDELGGHIVSGHVDGTAKIVSENDEGDAHRFQIQAPKSLAPFIAQKGSVCLDGTSLTVNAVNGDIFDVLLIRHSLNVTTWGQKKTGDLINIEIDPLARYMARMLEYNKIKTN